MFINIEPSHKTQKKYDKNNVLVRLHFLDFTLKFVMMSGFISLATISSFSSNWLPSQ